MRNFFLFFFFLWQFSADAQKNAVEVYDKMMHAMQGVRTCSFVLNIKERINGEMKYDEYVVKLSANPYKVYVYSVKPNPGAEAILVKGENHDKAVINANRFPIPTLNLSPYHSLLRKNHQFTLWHFGFEFIHNILNHYTKKLKETFFSYLKLENDVTIKDKSYFQLVLENKNFGYENYTVLQGENLIKIADKLMVNDNMILENNPKIKNFDAVKAGEVIKIPSAFGKKIIFYVDKNTFLPTTQIIYDDKGLYGHIELSSFVLNPVFKSDEFSRDNKKYGF